MPDFSASNTGNSNQSGNEDSVVEKMLDRNMEKWLNIGK